VRAYVNLDEIFGQATQYIAKQLPDQLTTFEGDWRTSYDALLDEVQRLLALEGIAGGSTASLAMASISIPKIQ